MRFFTTLLLLGLLKVGFAQPKTYDDGTRVSYRLAFVPLDFSTEWMTKDKQWSTKLSLGIAPNVNAAYYFQTEEWFTDAAVNPKVGLDFRKYVNRVPREAFYGYFMEVNSRYYFPLYDFNGYWRFAYHFGATWSIGQQGFFTASVGAALYNISRGDGWGIGPSGSLGIGIELN